MCITFMQRRPNVVDVGPTLYKCYTYVLCVQGITTLVLLSFLFNFFSHLKLCLARVVVSTAAFHARVRGSKETKMFFPHPRVKVSIVGSLRDRKVACLALDRQGSNFESCVWRTVSSQSSHHPQEVLLAQFNLYVHKGGLKPDSFHYRDPQLQVAENYSYLFI